MDWQIEHWQIDDWQLRRHFPLREGIFAPKAPKSHAFNRIHSGQRLAINTA